MDKVTDSGSVDAGSIPVRDTKNAVTFVSAFFKCFTCEIM